MIAQFLLGLRGGVFWFVVPLLVYRFSLNEAVVGGYSMLVNFQGVLTTYALSLWAKAGNRWQGLWISSWLLGLSFVGLFVKINYFTFLLYALLVATGGTWGQVVFGAFSFTILEKAREASSSKIEYLAIREVPLGLGRVIGVIGFLGGLSFFGEMGLRIALLILGFAHMGVFLFLPRNKNNEMPSNHPQKA